MAITTATMTSTQKPIEAVEVGSPSIGTSSARASPAALMTPAWLVRNWTNINNAMYEIQPRLAIRGGTWSYPAIAADPVEMDHRASSICTATLTKVETKTSQSSTKPTVAPSVVAVISSPEPTTAALGDHARTEEAEARAPTRRWFPTFFGSRT